MDDEVRLICLRSRREAELDREHGRAAWEVELTKTNVEYEVTIDAMTGKVISVSPPLTSATVAPSTSAPASTTVSADHARQIALQAMPGAKVTETDLDREHGRAAWEVELTKSNVEYDVTIDAVTGKVINVDHDSDAEDHD